MVGTIHNLFKSRIFYVKINDTLLLLFFKPLTFNPLIKTANFENESQMTFPKNIKSFTPSVDSVKEAGSFTIGNMEMKYNNFVLLTSYGTW